MECSMKSDLQEVKCETMFRISQAFCYVESPGKKYFCRHFAGFVGSSSYDNVHRCCSLRMITGSAFEENLNFPWYSRILVQHSE